MASLRSPASAVRAVDQTRGLGRDAKLAHAIIGAGRGTPQSQPGLLLWVGMPGGSGPQRPLNPTVAGVVSHRGLFDGGGQLRRRRGRRCMFPSSDSCSLSRHASDTRPLAAELGCTSRSGRAGVREGTLRTRSRYREYCQKADAASQSGRCARSVAQVAVECWPMQWRLRLAPSVPAACGCPILSGIA